VEVRRLEVGDAVHQCAIGGDGRVQLSVCTPALSSFEVSNIPATRWTAGRCRPIDFLQERQLTTR
jgi:hypothetical protein